MFEKEGRNQKLKKKWRNPMFEKELETKVKKERRNQKLEK